MIRFAVLSIAIVSSSCSGSTVPATPVISVSMAHFDDNFLTMLRVAMADHAATASMTKAAREAGVPLVYVNRRPSEATLPDGVVFVGSEEIQAARWRWRSSRG